jgi:hypothetical protein
MTTARQSYDPYKLIDEVTALLRERGLSPELPTGSAGEALGGAGKLLRALGVEPLMNIAESFERTSSRIWSEEDGLG